MVRRTVFQILFPVIAFIGGIITTQYSSKLSTNQFFFEEKVKEATNIAHQFPVYINDWKRLLVLSQNCKKNKDEEDLNFCNQQTKTYVKERNRAKDKLYSSMTSMEYFFVGKQNNLKDLIDKFEKFDQPNLAKDAKDLPPIEEWEKWEIAILTQLRVEIGKWGYY